MQTSSEAIEGSVPQSGEVLLRQVTLARARELAKTEDYEAALVLLLQMEPTAAALDLRARIEVHRGRYADARALWNEVLEEVPDHPGAKKGLRDVDRAVALGKFLRGATLVGLVLAIGSVAFLVLRPSSERPAADHAQASEVAVKPAPSVAKAAPAEAAKAAPVAVQPAPAEVAKAVPVVAKPAPAEAAKAAPVAVKLAPAEAANASPVAANSQPMAAAAAVPAQAAKLPEIAVPEGVSVRREGGAHVYTFDAGLFSEGVAFAPGARERVTALGRALAPHRDSIRVELIGHVDTLAAPERVYRNTELALARANAVLGRLSRTTRFPAEALGLRAVGERLGPLSDREGDPRNRTVALRVTQRAPL